MISFCIKLDCIRRLRYAMTMKKYHPFEILAALDCKSLQKPNEHGWVEITALVRRKKKGRGPGRSDKDHMGRSGGMRFRNTKGGMIMMKRD